MSERFPSRQWSVLRMCQANAQVRELTSTNPALGFCLANMNFFCTLNDSPLGLADILATVRQRDLLDRMGFPGTESSVRLFKKILPEASYLEPLLKLREALRNEQTAKLLSHLERINTGVLALFGNPAFQACITPKLLTQVSVATSEDERTEVPGLLQELLTMWPVLEPVRPLPQFQSVARLREAHCEISIAYCRRQQEEERRRAEVAEHNRQHANALGARKFPMPPLVDEKDSIVALRTVEQLREEDIEQENCVASMATWVADGRGYIYRILRPERATLAIVRGADSNWVIYQLRAKRNGPVSPATQLAVEQWLRRYSVSV